MIRIKPFLIATLLLTGITLPAIAQIGEVRSNLSVGINGGVNLNSASFSLSPSLPLSLPLSLSLSLSLSPPPPPSNKTA